MADSGPVGNAVKLIGELAVVPGSSELLDGNIVSGALHGVAGVAARALLGPIGLVLVAANSYSHSVSGKYLPEYVTNMFTSSTEGTGPDAQLEPPSTDESEDAQLRPSFDESE